MKTLFKTKTLLLGLFLSSTFLFGQVESTPVKNYHRLGIHAGGTTGVGFSYKVSRNDKYQIQLVAIPIASSNGEYVNAGLSLFRKVVNTRGFDILGYVGGNYSYSSGGIDMEFLPPVIPTRPSGNRVNGSFGLAFEVGTSELFKFNFQGGYGIYGIGDSNNWTTYPSLGIGLEFGLNQILSKN